MTAETDDVIARRIAEEVTKVPEDEFEGENIRFGYLIKGFPFNTSQALMLDRYLNGVNLALHIKSGRESGDYLSSIQSLLSYYEERVRLSVVRVLCWSYHTVPSPKSESWSQP